MNFLKKLFSKKTETKVSQEDEEPELTFNTEEAFSRAIEILSKYKRIAYLPKVKENTYSFSPSSKIGGFPYLRNETDWPICPNCQKNMQLFLQLNLEELPEKKEKGLIQLFYCTTSEPLCVNDLEAFFPFSAGVICRKIEITGLSKQMEPVIDEIFPEKTIVNWEQIDDYPHFEEYEQLGIDIDLQDEVYELMEKRQIGLPIERDKLFGWPYWVQSVEYPFDRQTETQMELVFQFDSEDNLPYMFGDAGVGHLTQSPDNKNELAFGWACS